MCNGWIHSGLGVGNLEAYTLSSSRQKVNPRLVRGELCSQPVTWSSANVPTCPFWMTASKATAERQGLLLTTNTKEFSILTFDFAEEETRARSGSQIQIRLQGTLVGVLSVESYSGEPASFGWP